MSELFEAAKPLLARFAAYLEQHPDQRTEWSQFLKSALTYVDTGAAPLSIPTFVRSESRSGSSYSPSSRYASASEGSSFEAEREQVPLTTMANRCRIKAEASRVLVRRYSNPNPGHDPEDTTALFKKASELPDCGLWMLTGSGFNTSPTVWENMAGAYEAASYACDLMDRVLPRNDVGLEIGLNLAAESQSTLLYAVIDTGRRGPDTDQIELFIRIRETGALRRIYIPKFLKRDDRADPDNWKDVLSRLQKEYETYKNLPASSATAATAASSISTASKAPGGKAEKTMHSLRYQFKKLKESPAVADWDWVFKLIDEATQNGVAPSDPELRELILPVLSSIPDDVPATTGMTDVFKELDKYLMARGSDDRSTEETPSPQVSKVATMLGGKEIALIGGMNRPAHTKALIEAFDLSNLKWIVAPEASSSFENEIAKPDISMVLYSPRWSGVKADDVQAACEKLKKPFVKLTKGVGPNQVASDITRR
jgi:hypothetical protein